MDLANRNLPKGFITVDEACELIRSDSKTDAKVDTKYLVQHLDWIEVSRNFRIPKVRTATEEDIKLFMQKNPGRRPRATVEVGSVYVAIETPYQKELLAKTIRDHYRDMVGREYMQRKTRSITTVADEEGSGMRVQPRVNPNSIAKEGDTISSGRTMTTNSEGMTF